MSLSAPAPRSARDKKKKLRKLHVLSNPATKYYDPTDTKGIRTYFPPPDYEKEAQAEREVQLREHPPWGFRAPSVSDPTYRRRQAEAERRVRDRVGFTRAEQLSVQRTVGVASLLTGGTSNTGGAKLAEGPSRSTALLAPTDLHAYVAEHADTSLGRDLHRISEELDAVAADASAAAAAAIALAAAEAAARKKRRELLKADAMPTNEYQGKSARAIAGKLMMESVRNLCLDRSATALGLNQAEAEHAAARARRIAIEAEEVAETTTTTLVEERNISQSLADLKRDIFGIQAKSHEYLEGSSKQTAIEIEQLNARVVEAETKLKTEVTRIKKKMQMTITELEMSLDVANRNNLELQKTIKKQSIQLTELQAHYDETQRQLAVTLDQYGIAQRRLQSLTSELEETRANYESALRSKRTAEQLYEEAQTRINELTTINVNLAAARSKLEQELGTLAGDYEEVTKELRISDERYQRVQVELKHTVEQLHEEQERVIKIETIKKSLEIEVKNLSVRLEEVEANAIVGGKRIISKLEARMRDLELELDEEKRRHAETIKILRKKERHVKEVIIQSEEDQKNISLLQEMLDKTSSKVNIYKRQLAEQEGMSQQTVTRVRRFQRELEAAEDRAENAESNLSLIRAKHRTFVTTSSVPGSQVYMVQETRSSSEAF